MPLPETTEQLDRLDPLVWKITSVAVLGALMGQIDATVVNVSLSSLAIDLSSELLEPVRGRMRFGNEKSEGGFGGTGLDRNVEG